MSAAAAEEQVLRAALERGWVTPAQLEQVRQEARRAGLPLLSALRQVVGPARARELGAVYQRALAQAAPPAPPKTAGPPRPGSRLGAYEIVRELGQGGMGTVFVARHLSLRREVALKVLAGGPLLREETLRRFAREARTAARVRHPRVVTVHEVGEEGGVHYLAMDLVAGEDLSRRVEREGPLDPRQAAALGREVAGALALAHSLGVLHRDLKPHNVLLDEAGQPRLTDFGLARDLDSHSLTLTKAGRLLGTPAYMAPEQAAGDSRRVGPAADVYGLGATLYEALTGRPPFVGDSVIGLVAQLVSRPPPPPRSLRREVPRDLDTIVLRCLEKDPDQRYPSAQALAEDLEAFLAGGEIAARPLSRGERLRRWVQRRRGLAVSLALAGVVSAVAAAALLAGRRGSARPAPPAPPAARAEAAPDLDALAAALHDADTGQRLEELAATFPADPELARLLVARVAHAAALEAPGHRGTRQARAWLRRYPALPPRPALVRRALALLPEEEERAGARLSAAPPPPSSDPAFASLLDLDPSLLKPTPSAAHALEPYPEGLAAARALAAGDLPRALAALDAEDDPSLRAALLLRGPTPQEAAPVLERALLREPERADLWTARARLEGLSGQARESEGSATRALRLRPEEPQALLLRGRARLAQRDAAGAERDARALLARAPDDGEALLLLARAAVNDGRREEGLRLLQRAIDGGAPARALALRSLLATRAGDARRGLEDAEAALEVAPLNRALHARALARFALGEVEAGRADLDRAVRALPRDPLLRLDRARLRLEAGDEGGAREDVELALAGQPDDPGALTLRARLRRASGDVAGARDDLTRALEVSPEHPAARAELAALRRGSELAVDVYDEAQGLLDAHRPARAEALVERHLRAHPTDPEALRLRGLARAALGRDEEALEDALRASQLDPDDPQKHHNLAQARRRVGDLAGARAALDQALALAPEQAPSLNLRGALRLDAGDLAGAAADLERAVAIEPDAPDPWLNLGHVEAARGDLAGAAARYTRAARLAPERAAVFTNRAHVLQLSGDLRGALADWEEAYRLARTLAARFDLGLGLLLCGERAAALDHLAALAPEDAYAGLLAVAAGGPAALLEPHAARPDWSGLLARYVLGRLAEEDLLRLARRGAPQQVAGQLCEAHAYAGMLAEGRGDVAGARDHYRRALRTRQANYAEFLWSRHRLRALGE